MSNVSKFGTTPAKIMALWKLTMPLNRRELFRDVALGSLLVPIMTGPAGAADADPIEEKKCTLLGKHVLPEGKQAVQGLAVGTCTGGFTASAEASARKAGIRLWDLDVVMTLANTPK